MSATKLSRMTNLVESCSGYEEAMRLFASVAASQFADDPEPPAELTALLEALQRATEAAAALDRAVE